MTIPNLIPFIVILIIVGIVLFVTRNKEEKKPISVRTHKRTITVKGHSRSNPNNKAKSKKRRSSKR